MQALLLPLREAQEHLPYVVDCGVTSDNLRTAWWPVLQHFRQGRLSDERYARSRLIVKPIGDARSLSRDLRCRSSLLNSSSNSWPRSMASSPTHLGSEGAFGIWLVPMLRPLYTSVASLSKPACGRSSAGHFYVVEARRYRSSHCGAEG